MDALPLQRNEWEDCMPFGCMKGGYRGHQRNGCAANEKPPLLDLSQFFVPFCAFHGLFGSCLFGKVLSLQRKSKDNR